MFFSFGFPRLLPLFFFFNDTATTEIYTLSLHDALPIWTPAPWCSRCRRTSRPTPTTARSEEHTSELQSRGHLVCRLLLEKKKIQPRPRSLGRDSIPPGQRSSKSLSAVAAALSPRAPSSMGRR